MWSSSLLSNTYFIQVRNEKVNEERKSNQTKISLDIRKIYSETFRSIQYSNPSGNKTLYKDICFYIDVHGFIGVHRITNA